jgi:hypothetical protein
VIQFPLLAVVIDEFFGVGLDDADFGQDLVGGGGPGEWLGIGVPVCDVVADLVDEDLDRGEGAAADGLAGDDAKPGLDLVDPRGADGGEVEMDVQVVLEPGQDVRGGVDGQVSNTTWMSLPACGWTCAVPKLDTRP